MSSHYEKGYHEWIWRPKHGSPVLIDLNDMYAVFKLVDGRYVMINHGDFIQVSRRYNREASLCFLAGVTCSIMIKIHVKVTEKEMNNLLRNIISKRLLEAIKILA